MKIPTAQIRFETSAKPFLWGNSYIAAYMLTNDSFVLGLRDFQKGLGYDGKSETWLSELLQHITRFSAMNQDLLQAFENPVVAYSDLQAANLKVLTAENALQVLEIILSAKNNGYLNLSQLKFAKAAALLLDFYKRPELDTIIIAASGFDFYKANAKSKLQSRFKKTADDVVFQWVVTLPDVFFETYFRLYDSKWETLVENPDTTAAQLNDILFARLSRQQLAILRDEKPKRGYAAKNHKDRQHPILKSVTDSLLSLMAAAKDKNIFLQLLQRAHPKNREWSIKAHDFQTREIHTRPFSIFDLALKKGLVPDKTAGRNKA